MPIIFLNQTSELLNMKAKILLVSLLVLAVLLISGCVQEGSPDLSEWKFCSENSDCKSMNGCSAGCWNINFKGIECSPVPQLAGPPDCICYKNECQSSRMVAQGISVESGLDAALEVCDLNDDREMKEDCYSWAAYAICASLVPAEEFDESPCYKCIKDCKLLDTGFINTTCHINCAKTEW
jgi:hypothetical protein